MRLFSLFAFLLAIHTAGVLAVPSTYYWVDWNNGEATNPGYKTTGKITTSTTTVNVNFKSSGNIDAMQHGASGEQNFYGNCPGCSSLPGAIFTPWVSSEVANGPSTTDIIRLLDITTITLTFSTPVVNPVLAIVSNNKNTYIFNSDFEILSQAGHDNHDKGFFGTGEWQRDTSSSPGQYKLVTIDGSSFGTEPHGTIKLIGTFTTITWTTTNSEEWHGFTLGIKSTQGEALVNTGLGPAQGTVTCRTWGDPHVISFSGAHFDCHVVGRRNYYTTISNGITTTVDTTHTALSAPHSNIMVNSDVYVEATSVGEIHAQPNGQVFFTPALGAQVEVTTLAGASNTWLELTSGFSFIRNPSGAANKFGVYVAAAQLTVYFQRGIYLGSPYWNVDILAVRLTSDTGLCVDESCNNPPGPAPPCANGPTAEEIAAACLAAVVQSTNPLYTFCVADVSLACDLDVALTYSPPEDPPAPLTPNSPINGDPQFVGLQGQSYQVHGADDTVFALLSTPRMQMNGLFTYIGVGGECNYNETMCWSHPGTYISQLGFRVAHHDGHEDKILLIAGPHSRGLHAEVNGKAIIVNDAFSLGTSVHVHIKSQSVAQVHIQDLFVVEVTNSDNFFNMGVQLLRRDWLVAGAKRVTLTAKSPSTALSVYPSIDLHGLLGITWRNVVYPHNRVYEGDVMDYAMESHDMFDTDFQYTKYHA